MSIYSCFVSHCCLQKKLLKQRAFDIAVRKRFAIELTTLDKNILIFDRLCPLHLLRYALAPFTPARAMHGDDWCCCCCFVYIYIPLESDRYRKNKAQIFPPILTGQLNENGSRILGMVIHIISNTFTQLTKLEKRESSNKNSSFFLCLTFVLIIENRTITHIKWKPIKSLVYWVSLSIQLSKDKSISWHELVNTFWRLSAAVPSKSVCKANSSSCQCWRNILPPLSVPMQYPFVELKF